MAGGPCAGADAGGRSVGSAFDGATAAGGAGIENVTIDAPGAALTPGR